MILRMRFWGYLLAMGAVGFFGYRAYDYFFDKSVPNLTLRGIESGSFYAADLECEVASSKKGNLSLWLDDKTLVSEFRIPSGVQGHSFTIPTKTLSNGKHSLKAHFSDNTFHQNVVQVERDFYVDNIPLKAAFVKTDEDSKVFQGRTLHVQMQVNKEIESAHLSVLSEKYECFPESKNSSVYEAYIPVACEENPNEYLLSVDVTDKVGNTIHLDDTFQVVSFPFKKSTLHVSSEKVAEEKELGKASKSFEELMTKCADASPKEKLWKGSFCPPIEVERVSTEYGTVRTTQHKGMYAHKAIDVINAPKSVVWAPQNGKIVSKDRFVDTGNTVIIDHGLGVITMLCHLDSFADIEEGQMIHKGNPVGTIGKTGYASGYHLHWEMRVNNTHVDPMQWTKPIF